MSELLPSRRLTTQKEGLRVLSLAADLEGSEVFVPRPVRSFRLGFPPQLELVEVSTEILAVAQPIEQMISQRRRKICPLDLRH